jgi:hypothetical protein
MWCVLLILWLNLFCTTFFLGFFEATCWNLILVYELPCWLSIILLAFSLHHVNQSVWNEVISKQTLTFGIHFSITSKIGERKFVNWNWLCSYIECVRIAFQCILWIIPKWFKSNNIIIVIVSQFLRNCNPWWPNIVEKVVKWKWIRIITSF